MPISSRPSSGTGNIFSILGASAYIDFGIAWRSAGGGQGGAVLGLLLAKRSARQSADQISTDPSRFKGKKKKGKKLFATYHLQNVANGLGLRENVGLTCFISVKWACVSKAGQMTNYF
jgi:hypothetical protein